MKRIGMIFFAALLLLACQPAPENEIITSRNDGTLEEAIRKTASPAEFETEQPVGEASNQDSAYAQMESNPMQEIEAWREVLSFGNVTCTVDAAIHVIEGPKGVYEVERAPFDGNTVQTFLDHFAADAQEAYPSRDTVEELEQVLERILRGEEYEAADGSLQYRPYDGQEEDAKSVNEQIKQAREQTETFDPKELPLDPLPIDYTYVLPAGTRWSVRCNENKFYARTYRKMTLQSETTVHSGLAWDGEQYGASIGFVPLKKEDAIEKALEASQLLGAEHLGLAQIEEGRIIHPYTGDVMSKGWIVVLTRDDGNGIPVDVATETTAGLLQYEPSDYAPPWVPERMKLYVDENGVQSVEWTNRICVKEVINENVELLSINEIQEKVRLLLRYGLTWLGTQETTEIRVTEMRLTTLLCNKKDEMHRALLAPAWVITCAHTDRAGTTRSTILAVNALDGSRMDPVQSLAAVPNS